MGHDSSMSKFYCPSGHPTINVRFSSEEFLEMGLTLVEEAADADVIVAALLEELIPLMRQNDNHKKYLVWCDEPLWSNIFQKIEMTCTGLMINHETMVAAYAMNCFTGNVLFSNHHFLLDIYHLDITSAVRVLGKESTLLPASGERKIAAFLTYRNGGIWDYKHSSGIFGLNTLRSRIALEGALLGKVDVYGQGWPKNLALKEDEPEHQNADIFAMKLKQYSKYKFALCFENTFAPYYVTEKIWHSILAGCLPIYYAGDGHTIYQDLPRGSFIDYAEFENPQQMFSMIESISQENFDLRMSLCKSALFNSIRISDEGRAPRRMQLSMFAEKIKILKTL